MAFNHTSSIEGSTYNITYTTLSTPFTREIQSFELPVSLFFLLLIFFVGTTGNFLIIYAVITQKVSFCWSDIFSRSLNCCGGTLKLCIIFSGTLGWLSHTLFECIQVYYDLNRVFIYLFFVLNTGIVLDFFILRTLFQNGIHSQVIRTWIFIVIKINGHLIIFYLQLLNSWLTWTTKCRST